VDQVLSNFKLLLEVIQETDESAVLATWKDSDRSLYKPLSLDDFPTKRSGFDPFCDGFRPTHPTPEKRWYCSFCLNHARNVSADTILLDLEEMVKSESMFLVLCAVQSDKPVIEVGWFAYSVKEYVSTNFRDALSEATQIQPNTFAVQWQRVKEGSDDLYAMVVKAASGMHTVLEKALSAIYSSSSTQWPWGIRMRFVPYADTLKTKSPLVMNLKSVHLKFIQSMTSVGVDNLRESLDFKFRTIDRSGKEQTLTIREAFMGIHFPPINSMPGKAGGGGMADREPKGVFHGVVEYSDRRLGPRVLVVPYPEPQVGSMLGFMAAVYPYTILSYFYGAPDIKPLLLTHAVESEVGCSYDPQSDSMRTKTIKELDECLKQDALLFSFDLSLVEKDRLMNEKKRKADDSLVKRLDESSIGTLRAHKSDTAAGSSRTGTRPQP